MRPTRPVRRAAVTAVLALAALPGLVGSHEPSATRGVDAAAFREVKLTTARGRQVAVAIGLDPAGRSEGALDAGATVIDAATGSTANGNEAPLDRTIGRLPQPEASWAWKSPRSSMSGSASFYDHGTTAMRDVPVGTTIVICGAGGCVQTVVSDYGPARSTGRILDMYRPDFFRVCGCGWWSGTTEVTVRVY